MKNYVGKGLTLDLTAPSGGVVSGTAYLIGVIFGVANASAAVGVKFALSRTGLYTLPKATGEAWAEGAVLYWDNTNKRLTTTASGNTKVAAAAAAALSADTSGLALLPGII